MSHRSNRTVAITTLGCKVNQSDSDEWLRQFVALGYEIVDFDAVADAYVVNTCSVTHVADRKSRQLLRHARRQNPAALVVATGCYASVAPDEVARMVEVDMVVGDRDKPRLVEMVHDALEGSDEQPLEVLAGPLRVFGPRHRAFVKVSDGCDKFCAFCIVPYARGRTRSVDPDDVLAKIDALVVDGYREVVLTAVHIGNYGEDLNPPTSIRMLVDRILTKTNVERLRISSIEPEDFDRELLARWTDPRLCRHFHLALDSGCDATLRRMRRRYTSDQYRELVRCIRAEIPDVAITTDVMVGFPGETVEEFEESCRFVSEQAFALIHVFPYSPRRRTTASKLPGQIDPVAKRERTERMLAIADESSARYRERFVGRTASVLVEHQLPDGDRPATWEGLTDNYLRVHIRSSADLMNQIVTVRLTGTSNEALVGELVGSPPLPWARIGGRVELTSASR